MSRYEFNIKPIVINGVKISKVIVDDHVQKHKDISDKLILHLVNLLDGDFHIPDDVKGKYEYYASLVIYDEKQYRFIWLLEKEENYIGVITVYRDRRKK